MASSAESSSDDAGGLGDIQVDYSPQPLAERQATTKTKKLKLFHQRSVCAPLTFETI
jgi:hypothetical protein